MNAQRTIPLHLDGPPHVEGIGVGVHGVRRRSERWLLPDLYSLHLYRYEGQLVVDGTPLDLRPGLISVVPPGSLMEFAFGGPSEHLYVHFALEEVGEVRSIPLLNDLGLAATDLADRVRAATTLTTPAHLSAEIWGVLWRLVSNTSARSARDPISNPAVQAAIAFIEDHLGDVLSVSLIAQRVQFSPSHLDRLFRAGLGATVAAYVLNRRMTMARHLLEETSQSISLVASSVGFSDLHVFNKACRRSFGASPRTIREPGVGLRGVNRDGPA